VLAGDRPETIGHSGDRFCRTEHKVAIVGNDARQAIEHMALGLAVEIHQHVAAENDVKTPKRRKIPQQIELTPSDHGAKFGSDLPLVAGLGEMPDQKLDRQSTLHFEMV